MRRFDSWHPDMRQPRLNYCSCVHKKQEGWTRDDATGLYVCARCHKPTDTGIQLFQYECALCESDFIKNFSHPAYNYNNPICWFCLEENYPNDLAYIYVSRFAKVPPPVAEEDNTPAFDFMES